MRNCTLHGVFSKCQYDVQGLLTNSQHDINVLIDEDFAALAGFLGDQKYFFGSEPTVTDACVFAFLQIPLYSGHNTSYLQTSIKQHSNLVRFVDHVRQDFFADRLSMLDSGHGKTQ